MSQRDILLKALRRGPITPIQALHIYGVFRLAARVLELKRQGYDIRTRMVCSVDNYGCSVRYAEYSLVQP